MVLLIAVQRVESLTDMKLLQPCSSLFSGSSAKQSMLSFNVRRASSIQRCPLRLGLIKLSSSASAFSPFMIVNIASDNENSPSMIFCYLLFQLIVQDWSLQSLPSNLEQHVVTANIFMHVCWSGEVVKIMKPIANI
ncbi:hypothetical protein V6N13_052550 [Hibiscus sabdariffa]|uniref:Uncharacterized protein n=1 Tax=Hibiscus sabdariffa TaxID=183260 RepID=A0ABR2Q597_9ROSI